MQEKDIFNFMQTILNISSYFAITKINKSKAKETQKPIRVYLKKSLTLQCRYLKNIYMYLNNYSYYGITKFSVMEYAKIQNKMDICKNNFIWVTSFFKML